MGERVGDVAVEVALGAGARHAEGPMWDAMTARLWWVDIVGRRVHCFDPESGEDRGWSTDGQPGGVVLDADGGPVVATPEGLGALDTGSGAVSLLVPVERDQQRNRANDIKVDRRGRAWVGTMALDKRVGAAALYRVDGDAAVLAVGGLTISNGPAFDERRARLYLADTGICAVDVFHLDFETGELAQRRRFLDFTDVQLWPDGMTVDDEGLLWVALGRSGSVHRYRADGTLDGMVRLPTSNPTSVAFGGGDGGDLYVTTSWSDLEPDDRSAQPLAGAVFRCRPGVTGPAAPRFARRPA